MSELLRKAFDRIRSELSESEQDRIATWLLELIDSGEREWNAQFAASREKLSRLADAALEEYAAGQTEVLDPKKL